MPSAILLRKNQLALLQEKIIPDIRRNGARRLAVMHLPLKLPEGMTARELSHPPLKISEGKKIYPDGIIWEDVQLHAMQYPSLYCLVEGEVDLLMGVSTVMLGSKSTFPQCGGYIVALSAPAFALFPPHVPQKRGQPPWERAEPHVGTARIFHVRVLPIGALCSVSILKNSVHEVQYSLLVNDSKLLPIMEILLDELNAPSSDPQIVQAQLLSLMLRLQHGMIAKVPPMIDGLYSRFPDDNPVHVGRKLPEHPVIRVVHEYIKLHLAKRLTPHMIAAQVRLSSTQLNRILRRHIGLSIMEYVLHLRMEVAQLLLRNSSQSVQEIALLTGYSKLPHFSRTFHHYVGISPSQFRHQHRSHTSPH